MMRRRVVGHARILAIVCLVGLGLLAGFAASASAAGTCKNVSELVHLRRVVLVWRVVHLRRVVLVWRVVHHRRVRVRVAETITVRRRVRMARTATVRRRVRVCESASVSLSTASVPSSGGAVTVRYGSSGAATCTLISSPALWRGADPARVDCRGAYTFTLPAAGALRRWTLRFTARNRFGQVVSSSTTLTQQAPPAPPPGPPVNKYTSSNWSGWALEGGPFTDAEGTFNVPSLYASAGTSDTAEWVGIDGFSNSALIQAGVSEEYDPSVGLVRIWAWWEELPAPSVPIAGMVVAPGDRVTVQVFEISGSVWGINIIDTTTGQRFGTQQVVYAGPGASAEWIVEAPTVSGALATLGDYSPDVTFS